MLLSPEGTPEHNRRSRSISESRVKSAEPSDAQHAEELAYAASDPSHALAKDTAGNGALEAPEAAGWSSKTPPWYVRNSRWLMAGALLGGTCGFASLGFF